MTKRPILVLASLLLLTLAIPSVPDAPDAKPWDPALGTATLSGKVKLDGKKPRTRPLDIAGAADKCAELHGGTTLKPETVVLTGNGRDRLFGRVSEDGDEVVVEPVSAQNPLVGERRVPRDEVASIQRGTVFTMALRDDVTWHDGKPFDAHAVSFPWQCYWHSKLDS